LVLKSKVWIIIITQIDNFTKLFGILIPTSCFVFYPLNKLFEFFYSTEMKILSSQKEAWNALVGIQKLIKELLII